MVVLVLELMNWPRKLWRRRSVLLFRDKLLLRWKLLRIMLGGLNPGSMTWHHVNMRFWGLNLSGKVVILLNGDKELASVSTLVTDTEIFQALARDWLERFKVGDLEDSMCGVCSSGFLRSCRSATCAKCESVYELSSNG